MSDYYGGGSYTVPAICSHGMAWSLPCAACNRPDTRPIYYNTKPDPVILAKLDRIIELLEARAAAPAEAREEGPG